MPSDVASAPVLNPHRRIWAVAGPAIASNTSGALVGVVDTWAIGHLPSPLFLAAVAIGAFIFHFVYWGLGFLRMGTTGLVAQAHGARDESRLLRITLRAIALGLVFGALVLALQRPLLAGSFLFFQPTAEQAPLVDLYYSIRIWAVPAMLIKLGIVGMLIGTQRATIVLGIELILSVSNAGLTILFVVGFGWEIRGVASASLIAEWLAAVVALVIAARLLGAGPLLAAARDRAFWRLSAFRGMLAVNAFIFVRTLLLLAAFAIFLKVGGSLSPVILAANHVLMNFITLAALGLDGVAFAAEALVGEAKGEGNRRLFARWVRLTNFWAVGLSVGYALAYWLLGAEIVNAFTDLPEVRAAAGPQLLWFAAIPVIAVWSYQYDGIFIGATWTREMLWTMAIAFTAYLIALKFAVPAWGNAGLWASFTIFLAARGLAQAVWYPFLERQIARPAPE